MELREAAALLVGHEQLHRRERRQEAGLDGLAELLEALPRLGRDLHGLREAEGEGVAPLLVDGVDLVEGEQARSLARAGLDQHVVHRRNHLVQLVLGYRGVGHVDDQVGPQRLLERRRERIHERVGQLADEADGVGDQVAAP